jgi:hypothetical protein
VLARVSWWRGKARSELPTVRPKVAAVALRRRQSSSCNWMATSGRGAPVSYGEACARVDWDGGGLVLAVHGDAVRGRSKRRRRRWNGVERSELCTGTGGIERRHHRKTDACERQEVKALW